MDQLDTIGFIPNGGRIYCMQDSSFVLTNTESQIFLDLDRSQPPLFIQMLSRYVTVTHDMAILNRALPLAEVNPSFSTALLADTFCRKNFVGGVIIDP